MAKSRIIKKSDFAEHAGISRPSVTKLCAGRLKNAVSGKYIDLDHSSVVEYLQSRKDNVEKEELPEKFRTAIELCGGIEKLCALKIRTPMGLKYPEAVSLINEIKEVPEKKAGAKLKKKLPAPKPITEKSEEVPLVKMAQKIEPPIRFDADCDVPENISEFADMTLREIIHRFGTDTRFVDYLGAVQKLELINEKRLKNAQLEGSLVSRNLVSDFLVEMINAAHQKLLTDGAKTISIRAVAMHTAGKSAPEIELYVSDQMSTFIRPMKSKMSRALKNA